MVDESRTPHPVEARRARNPLRSRLGRRLLGWFVVLSLVPLIASNTLGYVESGRIIQRLIGRQLAAIAGVEATHIRDQIDRLLTLLDVIVSANPDLARLAAGAPGGEGRELLAASLTQKLDEAWEFDALFIERRDGGIVAVTGAAESLGAVVRTRSSRPGGARVEVLDERSRAGRPVIRLTVPLGAATGAETDLRIGALIGSRAFAGVLDIPPHLGGTIESFVLDGTNRPLFVSHPHGYVDYSSPLETGIRADVEVEAGTVAGVDTGMARLSTVRYEDRQGVEVLGLGVPIEELGWTYVAEFPVDEALGPLRLLRRISIIFGSIFGLVVVGTGWFVSGRIVAPVLELAAAAERVGAGELDVPIEAKSDDEIGDLGAAFDGMMHNLAEARDREAELHRREIRRAQQLATVGELASGVAHEIKNPVAGIAGGLDLVERRLGADDSLRPIIHEMSAQVDRIEVAIRDLLTFARPPEPRRAAIRPDRIVERALTLVQPAAERAQVELHSEETAGPSRAIHVDAELLRQALVNLSVNAVQATPSGGVVRVSVEQTELETKFCIADTGRGIGEDRMQEIFRPFFTTRHAGSGLGLSISREIVERHGGHIDVESEPGKGSTFTIRVPNGWTGEAR